MDIKMAWQRDDQFESSPEFKAWTREQFDLFRSEFDLDCMSDHWVCDVDDPMLPEKYEKHVWDCCCGRFNDYAVAPNGRTYHFFCSYGH